MPTPTPPPTLLDLPRELLELIYVLVATGDAADGAALQASCTHLYRVTSTVAVFRTIARTKSVQAVQRCWLRLLRLRRLAYHTPKLLALVQYRILHLAARAALSPERDWDVDIVEHDVTPSLLAPLVELPFCVEQQAPSIVERRIAGRRRARLSEDALRLHFRQARLVLVEAMLAHGADPNEFDGWPLRFAAHAGDADVLRLLLDKGARLSGDALVRAIEGGHYATAALLIGRGVDIHTGQGEALRAAVIGGHTDMVRLLCHRGAADPTRPSAEECVNLSAQYGRLAALRILLDHGVRPPRVKRKQVEPTSVSLMARSLGFDPIVDEPARTPLQLAADNGHADVVKLLMERHLAPPADAVALCRAVYRGREQIVAMLLDARWSAAALQSQALRLAALKGRESIARLLLERGANATAMRNEAVILASDNGHAGVVALLLKHGASRDVLLDLQRGRPVASLAHLQPFDTIEGVSGTGGLFIDQGIDVDRRSADEAADALYGPRRHWSIRNMIRHMSHHPRAVAAPAALAVVRSVAVRPERPARPPPPAGAAVRPARPRLFVFDPFTQSSVSINATAATPARQAPTIEQQRAVLLVVALLVTTWRARQASNDV